MAGKFVTGLSAGAGSFIGLVIGAGIAQAVSKESATYETSTATQVIGSLFGMTAGAFAGAFLAANSDPAPATGTAGLPRGVGAAGLPAGLGVTPHKCTAKSATAIAQQIPGAPWVYTQSMAPGTTLPTCQYSTNEHDVTTPTGRKRIPVRRHIGRPGEPTTMVLECPWSHELFVFQSTSPAAAA